MFWVERVALKEEGRKERLVVNLKAGWIRAVDVMGLPDVDVYIDFEPMADILTIHVLV